MPELYEPKLEDLRFREKYIYGEETISYNRTWGGTISFPESRWFA
ncbi:MAG: hypothetical protein ACOX04_01645 [Candidatus Scatomorpha sp.]|jgi:hypothetical protein